MATGVLTHHLTDVRVVRQSTDTGPCSGPPVDCGSTGEYDRYPQCVQYIVVITIASIQYLTRVRHQLFLLSIKGPSLYSRLY